MQRRIIRCSVMLVVLLCMSSSSFAIHHARLERIIRLHGLTAAEVPVVTAVSIQPSGHLLATAGDDHVARLWNVSDGRLVRELRGHQDWVTTVAFSPDGSQLITGSRDRNVFVWDVATGETSRTLGQHQHPISKIVVSAEQGIVAVAGFRAPLKVYDLRTGRLQGSLNCPCSDIRAIAFSPDMRFIAAGGRSGKIRVWNLKQGEKRDIDAHAGRISSVVFTDDNRLLSAGQDVVIPMWDAGNGNKITDFMGESGKVLSMTMLGEDQFATASTDNLIRLYNLNSAEPISILRGHTGSIATLDFHDNKLISGSFDTTVRVWAMLEQDASMREIRTTRVMPTVSPDELAHD